MAYDKVIDSVQLETAMKATADAIRAKTRDSAKIEWKSSNGFAEAVSSISGLKTDIVSFSQMNDKVTAYLSAADSVYTNTNGSSVSVIANYETAEGNYDRPLGFPLTATSGNLYLQIESSGVGWKLPAGSDDIRKAIYNTVPNEVSQYLVKDANANLTENGRIKSTGKVRMIKFNGFVRNCRDLGGWACDGGTVNYGKLFRSATVHTGETWIDPLIAKNIGIRHHIDFRSDSEANYITESSLGPDVHYHRHHLSLYYADIIDTTKADYENAKKVLHTIIDAVIHNEGVIYNCSLGRDRTGTITLMLLALLGVSKADIDKDYELSSFSGYGSPEILTARRTRTDYQALATYLSSFGGSNLRDNAVMWYINAGFDISKLNAFRSAMINGTPVELKASDYVTMYSVKNNLTGCTTSNTTTSVQKGTSYKATLSFASGYNTFSSVKVTMGGTDVTSSVYANGVINISSITGDIVITAVAVYASKYTNLLPTAVDTDGTVYDSTDGKPGYKTGARLSSSGAISSASGMDATGFIKCKMNDIVRLQGINFNSNSSNYGSHRVAFYDSSKTYITNSIHQGDAARSCLNGQYDSSGDLVQFTVKNGQNNLDLANTAFFRICGDTFDSGAIITVNEEIK